MVEAGGRYLRWRGGSPLRTGPAIHVIAFQEIKAASRDIVFLIGAAVAVFFGLNSVFNLAGDQFHTTDQFLFSMQNALIAAVAISAVLAGPRILDDIRFGALEIYLTRGVSPREYLAGKIAALFGIAFLTVLITGLLYYLATVVRFDEHPADWVLIPLGILALAILWGLVVSGVGLAIASLTRSSRVALLVYVGFFLFTSLVLPFLLELATVIPEFWVLSPMMALLAQSPWLFGFDLDEPRFPLWWGIVHLVILVVLSWAIFLWRRPRLRGQEVVQDE